MFLEIYGILVNINHISEIYKSEPMKLWAITFLKSNGDTTMESYETEEERDSIFEELKKLLVKK